LLLQKIALTMLQALLCTTALNQKPHIIHIIADDLGWSEVGYHRTSESPSDRADVKTPNIDALVAGGIELDRFYTDKICSPSRCSFQSGRAPIHVNVQNVVPEVRNPADPDGGYQGMPVNMTGIAEHMKAGGYKTHIVGKWDVGMATEQHTPRARGYDSWLGYWHHANDYWSHSEETCPGGGALPTRKKMLDLWRYNASSSGPARDLQNGPDCSQSNQAPAQQRCVYEERTLTDEVKAVITAHDATDPLFLVWSMHLVHMPLQVPTAYLKRFPSISDSYRQKMHAMVSYVDDELGEVVTLLKQTGIWNNSIVVFHADNGGEIMAAGICGGNNWPLRGGKFSNWEGGIRAVAFATGGHVPSSRRGTKETGLIAIQDFYATYAALAKVDPTDHKAAAGGLPPIDSLNMWPLLSGHNATSPRTEIQIGDTSAMTPNGDGKTLVGGLIWGRYKLLLGAPDKLYRISQDVRTGPSWPNSSSHLVPLLHSRVCGRKQENGCLFDVVADPFELTSIAEQASDLFTSMLARVDELQQTVYSPVRGSKDKQACTVAEEDYKGYWGPFVDI